MNDGSSQARTKEQLLPSCDRPDELDGHELLAGDDAPGGRELEDELDHAEQVDVGVVDGEVHEHGPGGAAHPERLLGKLRLISVQQERDIPGNANFH